MGDRKPKFNIKPFRAHVPMDQSSASSTWNALALAIDEIYNRNASQLSFEELYRNAYNLVLHKHGALLYEGVSDKISSHLARTVERLADVADSSLLDDMARTWSEHQITMIMVRDILMYMDRTYVPAQRRRPVYELGLHLFRVIVWEHPRIQNRVRDLLLHAIASERAGLLTDDRSLLKANLGMLLELGQADHSNVYERDFEGVFLASTQEFYRNESLSYLSQNTATDYVTKATQRMEEEKDRSSALALPSTTETPLQKIVHMELIERHARTLVDMPQSGFAALLKDETKSQDMMEMYDLFVRVPSSVDNLRDALCDRIKTDGKALLADQERGASDASSVVRGVLAMRERYTNVVAVSFRGELRAQKRMKESFEDFLNEDVRAASCLAVYVDELLRMGLKGATEQQIKDQLQKVIIVFRYLSDKDVFENFYKQHLAKRLLGGRSVSDEAERAMVSELKAECGYQFTTKLEGMFNDMRISRDMRDAYNAHKSMTSRPGGKKVDMEVDVLTLGNWPSQNVKPCTLPSPVQDAIKYFETFYLEKHTGRKLAWQTSAGQAEVKAMFGNGKRHDLLVSTYQMCILMLFNEKTTYTLGEIRTATQIPDMELRRHLISLCTPKHRILKKGSKGRGITRDDDTFTFNPDYTSKMKRVRIPLVKESSVNPTAAGGSSAEASSAVPAPVEEDRRHLVEAAIVRIMKARKSLSHNELIAEVARQLTNRFNPTPQFIKKRIESLIEREYLERTDADRRIYQYVA